MLRAFKPAVLDEHWTGREQLVRGLASKLAHGCRVLSLVGLTGIGKTALSEGVLLELVHNPDFAGRPVLRHIFDREEEPQSFAQVVTGWLARSGVRVRPEVRHDSAALSSLLLQYASQARPILILDAIERILEAEDEKGSAKTRFREQAWLEICRAALKNDGLGLQLITTSQDNAADLQRIASDYPARSHREELHGLEKDGQKRLFSSLGLSPGAGSAAENKLERIANAYGGHPFALRTIAGEIRAEHSGSIESFWSKHGEKIEDVERALSQALEEENEGVDPRNRWRLLAVLEDNIKRRFTGFLQRLYNTAPDAHLLLCMAALYDRPETKDRWFELMAEQGIEEARHEPAYQALRQRFLVEVYLDERGQQRVSLHNLVHSAALKQLHEVYGSA